MAVSLTALQLCSCVGGTGSHEHIFSNSWEYNELLHWQSAICSHTELTKNLGEHTFSSDGKCTVCGYEEAETPTPTPEPHRDVYFLPSGADETVDGVLSARYTFDYTNDLHGFTETKLNYINGFEDYGKDVNTFSFNEDYTTLTLVRQEYEGKGQTETLTRQRKYEYEFFENDSYKVRCDEYDLSSETYVFSDIVAKYYNEKGKLLSQYEIYSDEEDNFYFPYAYTYEYDEQGYLKKALYYNGNYSGDEITYLESFSLYEYDATHSTGVIKEYYYSEDGYYFDGHTEISTELIDGIRYQTEVIYAADGSKGNTNKFGYDENGEKVYVYYGGFPMEESIEKNEFNQIVHFSHTDEVQSLTMTVNYAPDGGNILSSTQTIENDFDNYVETSTYQYTAANQFSVVSKSATGDVEFTASSTLTYTELQNDALLKYIELYQSLLRYYSDNVLVEGLI